VSRPLSQLRRMLLLLPAAWKAGPAGLPLEKAVKVTGARNAREIEDIVTSLGYLELGPSMPDDFLSVSIENGRVYVDHALRFLEPLPLSLREGAALVAALRPFERAGGRTVASAIRKLRRAVPEPLRGTADDLARATDFPVGPPGPHASALAEAIQDRREVTLEYRAEATGIARPRAVEPRAVFHREGHWYLAAWDPERGGERLYRLDRIAGVTPGTRVFGEHKGPPLERYRRRHLYFESGAEREVVVRLRGSAAEQALGPRDGRTETLADGSVRLTVRVTPGNFLLGWVLGLGGEGEIEAPADAREMLRTRVEELSRRYAGPPSHPAGS
jgi:proteasome accessory factor C